MVGLLLTLSRKCRIPILKTKFMTSALGWQQMVSIFVRQSMIAFYHWTQAQKILKQLISCAGPNQASHKVLHGYFSQNLMSDCFHISIFSMQKTIVKRGYASKRVKFGGILLELWIWTSSSVMKTKQHILGE